MLVFPGVIIHKRCCYWCFFLFRLLEPYLVFGSLLRRKNMTAPWFFHCRFGGEEWVSAGKNQSVVWDGPYIKSQDSWNMDRYGMIWISIWHTTNSALMWVDDIVLYHTYGLDGPWMKMNLVKITWNWKLLLLVHSKDVFTGERKSLVYTFITSFKPIFWRRVQNHVC